MGHAISITTNGMPRAVRMLCPTLPPGPMVPLSGSTRNCLYLSTARPPVRCAEWTTTSYYEAKRGHFPYQLSPIPIALLSHPSNDRGGNSPCICSQVRREDCRTANAAKAGLEDGAQKTRVVFLVSGTKKPPRATSHHPEAR